MRIERRKVTQIQVAAVPFEGAERPLNERVVKELAAELLLLARHQSLPDSGFYNPIELAPYQDPERPEIAYRVVAGFTRHAAWLRASSEITHGVQNMDSLLCTIHHDCSETMLLAHHLRENVVRTDLPDAMRREWAGKLLKISWYEDDINTFKVFFSRGRPALADKEKSNKEDHQSGKMVNDHQSPKTIKGGGRPGHPIEWLAIFAERVGLSPVTVRKWWAKFRQEHGIEHVAPGDATQPQREAFATWLENARKPAAARKKAAQDAETAADDRLKAESRTEARQAIVDAFARYVGDYGRAAANELIEALIGVPLPAPEPESASTQQEAA